jgi:hypothetical protein
LLGAHRSIGARVEIQGGRVVTGPPEPREAHMDENIGGAGPAIAVA